MLGGVKELITGVALFSAIGLLVVSRPLAASDQDCSGHWESTSPLRVGVLGLSVDLLKRNDGEWVGSLSDPARKVFGIRVSAIVVKGDNIKFVSPDLPGTPSYDLVIRKNALQGTVSVEGNALPLSMKRTGKADVKVTPPNTAVSKELEGDWEGVLPGGRESVTFHFKNWSDQTVEASVINPSLRGKTQAFARVMQSGAEVEFTLFIFGGTHKGTINGEGTEMTGAWMQNPSAPPLPLKMRKR
jgi:hypothetical protein